MRLLLVLCGALFASVTAASAAPISNSEAYAFLKKFFGQPLMFVDLGRVHVQANSPGGPYNRQRGWSSNVTGYQSILGASDLGYVTVRTLKSPTGPMGVPLIAPHIFNREIEVELTSKGRQVNTWHDERAPLARIPLGTMTDLKVVKIKGVDAEADEYSVLYATFVYNFTDQGTDLMKAIESRVRNSVNGCGYGLGGEKCTVITSPRRKAVVLLKRDPFKDKWNFVAYDTGPLDGALVSNRVNDALRSMGK